MTYYLQTKSAGKSGCSNLSWRKVEANTKKEAKSKVYGKKVVYCYTEEELKQHMTEQSAAQVIERAW